MEPRGKTTVEAEIAEHERALRDLRRELGIIKQRERFASPEARQVHAEKTRIAVLAKSPRTLPPMTRQQRGKYQYLRSYMGREKALAILIPSNSGRHP